MGVGENSMDNAGREICVKRGSGKEVARVTLIHPRTPVLVLASQLEWNIEKGGSPQCDLCVQGWR